MRAFETRFFSRWLRKSGLSERMLCRSIEEMANGLIDADLGGGLVKKRVPMAGRGKRGGARVIVATSKGGRWFFLFGFGKNERADVSDDELEALREIAADLLGRSDRQLDEALADGALQEICLGDQAKIEEPDPRSRS